GGRTQYRFVAELPAGLDAAARVRIVSGFCNHFAETGVMYEAVIHRPDAHNDARNYHLHLSVHDRPARLIGDRWDFEIAEPVEGQSGRVHYPYRQPKVAGFVRAPDGTDHRAYAAARVRELRARFADLCNEELAAIGSTLRFDPRRLEEMGIDRKATKPLGTRAAPLEAAGVPTRVGIANAEIIWNYELQEAARRAQVQAGDRRLLQKRLITALEGAEKAGDAAAVALLKNDIATLVDQSAVLDAHQADLAEYETTLTMARARPDKTAATCRAILQTVADGTASRSDRKAAQAIRVRLNEATAFLAQIDRIVSRDAELVAMTQHAAQAAEQDVQAIGERLVAFGNRARPQVEFKQAGPSAPASANTTAAPSSNRNTVEALLKRVLADDMSILLPDAKNPKFRVPGISRDELRVVVHPTWDEAVQNGLREISAIQVKRMHSAADYVAAMGMESLQRNAQMNGDARHALKHATAYWDHPVFQERLRQRSAALAPTDSSMEAGRSNPVGGLFRRLADSLDGLFALRPASAPDESDQVPALPPTPASVQPAAANEPTEIIDPRQTAINDLAEALIKDHRLRVEMTGGRLTIVPTEEGWERSIDAFSDEPAVQKAMRKRHVSPWLDVPHSERAATIDSIRDALRSPDRRPIARGATGWLLSGLPEHMAQQIRQWNGYDELEAILRKADNYWTSREEWRDRHPTALPDRRAPETSAKGLQRASVLPQPSVGLDQDLRDQHWIEWQRGQSR
ncbi:MAG TPA: MobA/MobL family protein, partial [Sphingobium sp.]|nr:MobA/MobL family protein [Sphingobium sp.]